MAARAELFKMSSQPQTAPSQFWEGSWLTNNNNSWAIYVLLISLVQTLLFIIFACPIGTALIFVSVSANKRHSSWLKESADSEGFRHYRQKVKKIVFIAKWTFIIDIVQFGVLLSFWSASSTDWLTLVQWPPLFVYCTACHALSLFNNHYFSV